MPLSRNTQNSRKNISFVHGVWATSVTLKSTGKNQDIFYFENNKYRVLHERSNIAAFSVVHQKFPEKSFYLSAM